MLKVTLLFILFGGGDAEYDAVARYNDSLLVYNTYHQAIEHLKTLKPTEIQQWYEADATNDRLTACAKVRLKKYNHQTYEPVTTFEREGMGTAYAYPQPGTTEHKTAEAFSKTTIPQYRFSVYDKQTRFLSPNSCVRIPYILKIVYDKGRLLLAEKLNPVTFEKLIAESVE